MFSVTVDAFSGRPNPTYVIGDDESREFLRDLPQAAISDTATRFDGLGFRGVVVEARTDDMTDARVDLPPRFVVGGGTAVDEDAASEFVERLIRGLRDHETVGLTAPTEDLIAYLLDLARRRPSARTFPDIAPTTPPSPAAIAKAVTCWIERSKFNPGFWNAADVVGRNNCYNYASNWRTDTFAQPGRGSGQLYTGLSCPEVTQAAIADGCHHRFDCFPDGEKPRRLVALVMAPGYDYHWYRIHSVAEGFWGHKPGGTAARNVDNSGQVITNPEACDRGPYTQFCGYFYTCNTQAHRIN
jgi:hypothetical protein